jgi:hypothetical protein
LDGSLIKGLGQENDDITTIGIHYHTLMIFLGENFAAATKLEDFSLPCSLM